MTLDDQDGLLEDHLAGLHFGAPDPLCWQCWDLEDDDGDNPECPSETGLWRHDADVEGHS